MDVPISLKFNDLVDSIEMSGNTKFKTVCIK
jgi:hypothetical protein